MGDFRHSPPSKNNEKNSRFFIFYIFCMPSLQKCMKLSATKKMIKYVIFREFTENIIIKLAGRSEVRLTSQI